MYSSVATQVLEINPDLLDKKRRIPRLFYALNTVTRFYLFLHFHYIFHILNSSNKILSIKMGPPKNPAGGFAGAHATALALSDHS